MTPSPRGHNSTLKRGGPLRRKTPLRNGTGALRQRKPLNPISDKRRKRMQAARKWKKGDCEIAHLLEGIAAWEGHKAAYEGRGDLWAKRDRHHVFGQPAAWDVGWNVVIVSRVAHEFEDNTWGVAGLVVCMRRLLERGDLKTDEFYIGTVGFNPYKQVEDAIRDEVFAGEPLLRRYADELLTTF